MAWVNFEFIKKVISFLSTKKLHVIGRSITNGFNWVVYIFVFGLFQVIILYGFSRLNSDFVFDVSKIMKDGVLIFFTIAVVSSVTLDFLSEPNIDLNKFRRFLIGMAYCLPILIWAVGIVLYVAAFTSFVDNNKFFQDVVMLLLYATFIHAFTIKTLIYISRS